MKINFGNYSNFVLKNKIKKIFISALNILNISYTNFVVNINFLDEQEIKKLNNDFRNINKETDVLSFPYYELNKGENISLQAFAKDLNKTNGMVCFGDIAICLSVAKKQAKEYEHSLKREICFLALHGFLHLLGFDHIEKNDEEEMMNLAQQILQKNKVVS